MDLPTDLEPRVDLLERRRRHIRSVMGTRPAASTGILVCYCEHRCNGAQIKVALRTATRLLGLQGSGREQQRTSAPEAETAKKSEHPGANLGCREDPKQGRSLHQPLEGRLRARQLPWGGAMGCCRPRLIRSRVQNRTCPLGGPAAGRGSQLAHWRREFLSR